MRVSHIIAILLPRGFPRKPSTSHQFEKPENMAFKVRGLNVGLCAAVDQSVRSASVGQHTFSPKVWEQDYRGDPVGRNSPRRIREECPVLWQFLLKSSQIYVEERKIGGCHTHMDPFLGYTRIWTSPFSLTSP